MKKTILSIISIATILSISCKTHYTQAETKDVVYQNNAYQICGIQNSLDNLFLGNSIYNSSKSCIRLEKSLRINNPSSKKLTFYFKFKEQINNVIANPFGYFSFALLDDNHNYLFSFNEQIDGFEHLKSTINNDPLMSSYLTDDEFFIEIDTSTFGNKLIICGDEYESSDDHFSIDMCGNEITIKQFMLYDGGYSSFSYQNPTVGIGANSSHVYTNNDTINYTINYDNRLSLEEIKKDIIAYDYYDKTQITPYVELDEYTAALNNNELGTFSVKLKATDKANNTTILNISLRIEDKTNPIYAGQNEIVIHYTDLPSNNLLDLTQYIYADDNHDGRINLDDSYKSYSVKMFQTETKGFTFTDVSGNSIEQQVSITITDNIEPTIEGEDSISVYQYQYNEINDLLNLYSFSDSGSGIKKTYIDSNLKDFARSGEYDLTIYAEDNCSNKSSKKVKLKIQDGVGPVFFVNVSSLSITNDLLLSAEEVINELINNGSINQRKYSKCSYITKTYEENHSKVGTYDTQIVCYDEEGNTDYYLVKLNVTKNKNSNFFIRFYSSMINFFKNLFNQIKDLILKILNFFKKD